MYQAQEGFLEELTVSWDLDEEQGLPRCRREDCLRLREQHMHRLRRGNRTAVCWGWGMVRGIWGFPGGVTGKEPAANAGDLRDMSSIYEWEYLQYYCLENPMDREAWQATVHGVTKSWTGLN